MTSKTKDKDALKKGWKTSDTRSVFIGALLAVGAAIALVWINNLNLPKEVYMEAGVLFLISFFVLIAVFIVGGALVLLPVWDKFSEEKQEALKKFGYVVAAIVGVSIFFFHSFIFGGQSWNGAGEVNLFTSEDSTKNYRVPAEINVVTKPWGGIEYEISEVTWPNGGSSSFSECAVGEDGGPCTDTESREWFIEVYDAPDYDPPVQ